MQTHITHPPMSLAPCTCGAQPKHYHDARALRANGGHFLECAPCDRRTSRHPELLLAEREWCRITGNMPPIRTALPVRTVRSIR
jgi:hypothetical protein